MFKILRCALALKRLYHRVRTVSVSDRHLKVLGVQKDPAPVHDIKMCVHVMASGDLLPGNPLRTILPQRTLPEVAEQLSEHPGLARMNMPFEEGDTNEDLDTEESLSYTDFYKQSKYAVDTKVKRAIFFMEKLYYGVIFFVLQPNSTLHWVDQPYQRHRDLAALF